MALKPSIVWTVGFPLTFLCSRILPLKHFYAYGAAAVVVLILFGCGVDLIGTYTVRKYIQPPILLVLINNLASLANLTRTNTNHQNNRARLQFLVRIIRWEVCSSVVEFQLEQSC